ncbi:hypothetical protein HT031_005849 [Scenedesmus sp. PABB004]|nr:hypothetical protein HT031_005849 [Scenedesmus sp. PABB004]
MADEVAGLAAAVLADRAPPCSAGAPCRLLSDEPGAASAACGADRPGGIVLSLTASAAPGDAAAPPAPASQPAPASPAPPEQASLAGAGSGAWDPLQEQLRDIAATVARSKAVRETATSAAEPAAPPRAIASGGAAGRPAPSPASSRPRLWAAAVAAADARNAPREAAADGEEERPLSMAERKALCERSARARRAARPPAPQAAHAAGPLGRPSLTPPPPPPASADVSAARNTAVSPPRPERTPAPVASPAGAEGMSARRSAYLAATGSGGGGAPPMPRPPPGPSRPHRPWAVPTSDGVHVRGGALDGRAEEVSGIAAALLARPRSGRDAAEAAGSADGAAA